MGGPARPTADPTPSRPAETLEGSPSRLDSDMLASCWIVERARSRVLRSLALVGSARRAAERARLIARRCVEVGAVLHPALARRHARWMADMVGIPAETGPLDYLLLQRLGAYVDAHAGPSLSQKDQERLEELGAPEVAEVDRLLADMIVPSAPPPEWPLAPRAEPPGQVRARFGIIGDPHIGLGLADRLTCAAVRDLNRAEVDFSVAVGDLTHTGSPELLMRASKVLGDLEAPLVPTVGNHDVWETDTDQPADLGRFVDVFDRKPYGIHEANGTRVVVINSVHQARSPFPSFDLARGSFAQEPPGAMPGGTISEEVADWMGGIERGGATFILLHHPPYPYLGFPPLTFGLDQASTRVLVELARRTGAWAIFCGHTHRCARYELNGIPVVEVPSVKDWPYGYGLVEVADAGWAYNLRPITDAELVASASTDAGLAFRRYAMGPDEARAFACLRPPTGGRSRSTFRRSTAGRQPRHLRGGPSPRPHSSGSTT
jgi:predicted phosphodiesterase